MILRAVLPIALLILSLTLYGIPLGPDASLAWWPLFYAFGFFLLWFGALWKLGGLAARWLGLAPHYFNLSLGSAIFMAVAAVSAHLGWLGYGFYIPVLLFLALCFIAALPIAWCPVLDPKSIAVLLLFLIPLVGCTFLLHPFPDPLWYHLMAPRLWMDAGRVYLPPSNPIIFTASYWEYLYLWGFSLLGSSGGGGLVAGQLFGQWLSLFVGGLGSVFGFFYLLKGLFPSKKNSLCALTVFCVYACFSATLFPELFLAKNDWGAILWSVSGLGLLMQKNSKSTFVGGLLLGIGCAAKLTNGFFILALAPLLVCRNRILPLLLSFMAGLFPLFLRNYYFTGNPVFPSLQKFFPYLGPTWDALQNYQGDFGIQSAQNFWEKLKWLLLETRLMPVFAFGYIWGHKKSPESILWIFLSLGFVLFALFSGPKAEIRLFGTGLVLLAGLSALLTFFRLSERTGQAFAALLLIGIAVLGMHFPWNAPLQAMAQEPPSLQIRQHLGGGALAWIRMHLKPEERAASANDTRLYYVSYLPILRLWDDPFLDRALFKKNFPESIRILREQKIRYLWLTNGFVDTYNNLEAWKIFALESEKYKDCLTFSTSQSRVIDLECLAQKP